MLATFRLFQMVMMVVYRYQSVMLCYIHDANIIGCSGITVTIVLQCCVNKVLGLFFSNTGLALGSLGGCAPLD